MQRPLLYGADDSVYVRIARLALLEKGIDHDLVPVDVFAGEGPAAWYLDLQPFGRIQAFEDDGFKLYETGAICRYVDEAFVGPALQPADARLRATMNQIIGIVDAYAYRALVWDLYVETVLKPRRGETTDNERVDRALPLARTCFAEFARLKTDGDWLVGGSMTLADLHLAPVIGYFTQTSMSSEIIAAYPGLTTWWQRVTALASWSATQPAE